MMNINRVHPADLKEKVGAYSGLIDIFVNNYDVEAQCAFFFLLI